MAEGYSRGFTAWLLAVCQYQTPLAENVLAYSIKSYKTVPRLQNDFVFGYGYVNTSNQSGHE